jgi:hypothetical protein
MLYICGSITNYNMAFFQSIKGPNGSYFTFEWTLGEFVGSYAVGFVVAIIAGCFLSLVIPTLWLLFYFISAERFRFWLNLNGALISLFFLFDYHFGWVITPILQPVIGASGVTILANYTVGIMLVHLTLLFFDRKIFNSILPNDPSFTDNGRILALFFYTVFMCILGYSLGKFLVHSFLSQAIFTAIQSSVS